MYFPSAVSSTTSDTWPVCNKYCLLSDLAAVFIAGQPPTTRIACILLLGCTTGPKSALVLLLPQSADCCGSGVLLHMRVL